MWKGQLMGSVEYGVQVHTNEVFCHFSCRCLGERLLCKGKDNQTVKLFVANLGKLLFGSL